MVTSTDVAEESGESKHFIKDGGLLDNCEDYLRRTLEGMTANFGPNMYYGMYV